MVKVWYIDENDQEALVLFPLADCDGDGLIMAFERRMHTSALQIVGVQYPGGKRVDLGVCDDLYDRERE